MFVHQPERTVLERRKHSLHGDVQPSMRGKYEWNKKLWTNEELHMMAARFVWTSANVKGQT